MPSHAAAPDVLDVPALPNDVQVEADSTPARPVPTRPSKKATISAMKTDLAALGLDTTGKKETLFKRLLAAFTRAQEEAQKLDAPRPRPCPPRQPYNSFLCFDVEGTCEAGTNFDYPNEIIEFPVVLLQWVEDAAEDTDAASDSSEPSAPAASDASAAVPAPGVASRVVGGRTRRLHIIDTFHTYVRPTWRPKLSKFCTSLTGIQQSTIDAAPTFPEVLIMFESWLDSWGLRRDDKLVSALWVTDGPWDLRDFVAKQLHITPTTPQRYPKYLLGPYLNLKRAVAAVLSGSTSNDTLSARGFKHTTGSNRRQIQEATGVQRYLNIPGQLEALGLGSFSGRQHSGIDDATNIARIVIELTERDALIESNAFLGDNHKRWAWMGKHAGEIVWDKPFHDGLMPLDMPKAAAILLGATDVAPPSASVVAATAAVAAPAAASAAGSTDSGSTSGTCTPPADGTPLPMEAKKKKKKKPKKKATANGQLTAETAQALAHDFDTLQIRAEANGKAATEADAAVQVS